jgi:hypothetical protein
MLNRVLHRPFKLIGAGTLLARTAAGGSGGVLPMERR